MSATTTMARHLVVPRRPAQLGAVVLAMFAVVALALAVIGLNGVVSYGVASWTREVGIRMALGASAGAITRLLAGSGVRLVLVGCALGLTLSRRSFSKKKSLGAPATAWISKAVNKVRPLIFRSADRRIRVTVGLSMFASETLVSDHVPSVHGDLYVATHTARLRSGGSPPPAARGVGRPSDP